MIITAFSLYDTKAGVFHTPFFMTSKGAAMRAVQDLASDMNTIVGRHPADFVLYQLGSFDDQAGQLMHTAPENLGPASSFLPQQRSLGLEG